MAERSLDMVRWVILPLAQMVSTAITLLIIALLIGYNIGMIMYMYYFTSNLKPNMPLGTLGKAQILRTKVQILLGIIVLSSTLLSLMIFFA